MATCYYLDQCWAKPRGCKAHHGVNITTRKDEANWLHNFRIADIVLLTPDRFHIDKNEYMLLVVVEIASPGDETYDKFSFYAGRKQIPEVWVIHRDTRTPEMHHRLSSRGIFVLMAGFAVRHGVEFRQTRVGKVWARIDGNESTRSNCR